MKPKNDSPWQFVGSFKKGPEAGVTVRKTA